MIETSVINVHEIFTVLSIEEVEKRINEVPDVESATVNYDAGSATLRYDETRLKAADIKPAVHRASCQSEDESKHKQDDALTPKAAKDLPELVSATATTKVDKPEQTVPAPQVDVPAPTVSDPKHDKSTPDAAFAKPKPETETPQANDHNDQEESLTLSKVATWVHDTFVGEDKKEPNVKPSTPETDVAKTSQDMPEASGHAGHTAPA